MEQEADKRLPRISLDRDNPVEAAIYADLWERDVRFARSDYIRKLLRAGYVALHPDSAPESVARTTNEPSVVAPARAPVAERKAAAHVGKAGSSSASPAPASAPAPAPAPVMDLEFADDGLPKKEKLTPGRVFQSLRVRR